MCSFLRLPEGRGNDRASLLCRVKSQAPQEQAQASQRESTNMTARKRRSPEERNDETIIVLFSWSCFAFCGGWEADFRGAGRHGNPDGDGEWDGRTEPVWYSWLVRCHALVNDRPSRLAWGAAVCSCGRGAPYLVAAQETQARDAGRAECRPGNRRGSRALKNMPRTESFSRGSRGRDYFDQGTLRTVDLGRATRCPGC